MNCNKCGAPMTHVAQYDRWFCDRCKAYGDIPAGSNVPMDPKAARTARTLVLWSHILGWGGVGVLFVGAAVAGVLAGGAAAGIVAGVGITAAVTGAIMGQVGRGMQGRVI
ncbi:MAG TPA: hypothetical protein VL172_11185 [Kofleriaceae bacterium]|jgi:hypothetical protein|nr:hypothetical protein [Kofleriaceae bacterium]